MIWQRKWATLVITMPSVIIHYHFLIAIQTSYISLYLGISTEIFGVFVLLCLPSAALLEKLHKLSVSWLNPFILEDKNQESSVTLDTISQM